MSDLTFWEHCSALRRMLLRIVVTLVLGTVLCFVFYERLLSLLLAPFHKIFPNEEAVLVLLGPLEGFFCATKVAFLGGIILTLPVCLFFLIQFIAPGLYRKEKKVLFPFLMLAFILASSGILIAYFLTLPLVLRFFFSFNTTLGENLWTLTQTLNLVLWLIAAHAIGFSLFAVLAVLIHFQVISSELLTKQRRLVILLIFIIAAILTPPDVVSQLLLAFPLMGLYELSIVYSRFVKKSSQFDT